MLDFECKVKGRKVDVFYEDMGVLVEQKNRGVSLDEASVRSKKAGAEIVFIKDENITDIVADDQNHIEYNGEVTTMSALAVKLMGRSGKSYQGPTMFTYEGEALSDRRARMEGGC